MAFFRGFYQLSLFLAAFLQFLSLNFLASSITLSSHLRFGFPLCLLPSSTATRTLLAGLCSSSPITCPAHLKRLILIYVTMRHGVIPQKTSAWRERGNVGPLPLLELPQSVYSHTPHTDVSVNDVPHIRQWSHKIIVYYNIILPLCYNCLQYSVQQHAVQVCSLRAIGYTI